MIVRPKEMRVQVRREMKGGPGEVTVLHMVECEDRKNIRFVGEMTIPVGAGIGDHAHENETEYYIIAEGIGIVREGTEDIKVGKGDVVITGGGASHSIKNGGSTPLVVIAFIVTE